MVIPSIDIELLPVLPVVYTVVEGSNDPVTVCFVINIQDYPLDHDFVVTVTTVPGIIHTHNVPVPFNVHVVDYWTFI